MYVPAIVKKRIDELGIARGELFTISKPGKKTRRIIEWVVAAEHTSSSARPSTQTSASKSAQIYASSGANFE